LWLQIASSNVEIIMAKRPTALAISVELRIKILRRQRVILDTDLAALYGVSVKRLNQQVKRNRERFPSDFMFQVTSSELQEVLRLQFATAKPGRGGRRSLPFAFTEHGAIMAATVLNSREAVDMSVFVVRAFVRMREMLSGQTQITLKLRELEHHVDGHDAVIRNIVSAIQKLMAPSRRQSRKIGFRLPAAG
jgi:ORF6N domain